MSTSRSVTGTGIPPTRRFPHARCGRAFSAAVGFRKLPVSLRTAAEARKLSGFNSHIVYKLPAIRKWFVPPSPVLAKDYFRLFYSPRPDRNGRENGVLCFPLPGIKPAQLPAGGKGEGQVVGVGGGAEGGGVLGVAAEPDGLAVCGREAVNVLPRGGVVAGVGPGGGGVARMPAGGAVPGKYPVLRAAEELRFGAIPNGDAQRVVLRMGISLAENPWRMDSTAEPQSVLFVDR